MQEFFIVGPHNSLTSCQDHCSGDHSSSATSNIAPAYPVCLPLTVVSLISNWEGKILQSLPIQHISHSCDAF